MPLDLTDCRNIHVSASPACAPEKPQADVQRFRKVTNSPALELQLRIARDGEPERVPPQLESIIVAARGESTLDDNGIIIQIEGQKYRYWHADSRTCRGKAGSKVLYVRARNFLDCIHVVTDDGRYVETIPLAATPDWFSADARRELKETRRFSDHIKQSLEKTHGVTTQKLADRARSTRETLQTIVDVPPDIARAPAAGADDRAASLADAMRTAQDRAAAASSRRASAEDVDVVEVLQRRGRAVGVHVEA